MTGLDCITESVARFEASLTGPPGPDGGRPIRTVAELARVAGYSVYHFTRLFTAVTGRGPKDYIAGRILSEAARAIGETDLPIAAIAERFGFPDYGTFSRAFRRRFLTAPGRVRELRYLPAGFVGRLEPPVRAALPPVAGPELVSLPAHTLTGLMFYLDAPLRSFARLWDDFGRVSALVAARTAPETFVQFTAWSDGAPSGCLSVLCALVTEPGAVQEPLFSTRPVPEATYLRFRHEGPLSALPEAYRAIYGGWFSSREEKPAGAWEFQRYPRDGRSVDIYIPVGPDREKANSASQSNVPPSSRQAGQCAHQAGTRASRTRSAEGW